jgi:hypothetical protein
MWGMINSTQEYRKSRIETTIPTQKEINKKKDYMIISSLLIRI